MEEPEIVVCGSIATDDSYAAACSACGSAIHPTIGTHAWALRHKLPMVCIACWRRLYDKDCTFGGIMHHGRMM